MALFNCPECGKEISDTVKKCPHCGVNLKPKKKLDPKKMKLVAIIGGASIVLIGAFIALYIFLIHPSAVFNDAQAAFKAGDYDEALKACDQIPNYSGASELKDEILFTKAQNAYQSGQYDEALGICDQIKDYDGTASLVNDITFAKAKAAYESSDFDGALTLLSNIADYEGADTLKDDIIWAKGSKLFQEGDFESAKTELGKIPESLNAASLLDEIAAYEQALTCSVDLKSLLKNPDSMQLFEIRNYVSPDTKQSIIMIEYSGQNGFGGMTRSYVAYLDGEYTGNCSSLDVNDIDSDDYKELGTWLVLNTFWDLETVTKIDTGIIEKALEKQS